SPREHALFDVLREIAARRHPGAVVSTPLATGFTDCHYFRVRGIPCYGFVPFELSDRDASLVHGNDERISIANLKSGTHVLYEIVSRLAGAQICGPRSANRRYHWRMASAFETDIPARLDQLAWSRFHWLVVIALGVTWALDGLEVTIVGALGSVLEEPGTLGLSATEVGLAGTVYIAGPLAGALLCGHLPDRHGRKRLFLITLSLYVLATSATALSVDFATFAACRFLTGMGIGGEYAAINSAIDELIPARVRGVTDLAINGSYWLGTALGAVLSAVLLDPRVLGHELGWRAAFGLGALLAVAIMIVRRFVPESPRWLLVHGRHAEAQEVVAGIEARCAPRDPDAALTRIRVAALDRISFATIARVIFASYRSRALLGLVLMIAQAFFYNAIFFTYALTLTRFYAVPTDGAGSYLLPFALG